MIRFDRTGRFFYLEDGTPEEVEQLDAKLNRVSADELKWHPPGPSRGLGDLVRRVTKAVGVRSCGGCRKRQERLNQLVPFSTHQTTSSAQDDISHQKNGEPESHIELPPEPEV